MPHIDWLHRAPDPQHCHSTVSCDMLMALSSEQSSALNEHFKPCLSGLLRWYAEGYRTLKGQPVLKKTKVTLTWWTKTLLTGFTGNSQTLELITWHRDRALPLFWEKACMITSVLLYYGTPIISLDRAAHPQRWGFPPSTSLYTTNIRKQQNSSCNIKIDSKPFWFG